MNFCCLIPASLIPLSLSLPSPSFHPYIFFSFLSPLSPPPLKVFYVVFLCSILFLLSYTINKNNFYQKIQTFIFGDDRTTALSLQSRVKKVLYSGKTFFRDSLSGSKNKVKCSWGENVAETFGGKKLQNKNVRKF